MSLYGWTDRDSQAITLVVNHPCNPVDARCEPVLESSPPFGFVVSSLQCQCSHFLLTRRFSLSASCLNSQSSISSEILNPDDVYLMGSCESCATAVPFFSASQPSTSDLNH